MLKSSQFKYQWFIPSCELDAEKPTAFLLRQMSKKQADAKRDREENSTRIGALWAYAEQSDDFNKDVKKRLAEARLNQGFDSTLYRDCVKEIRNVELEGELVESITDPEEIVKFIAGMEDTEAGEELDQVLSRMSELEEFEAVNFTPSAGKYSVCRTVIGRQKNELPTALSAPMVSQE